MLAKCIYLGQKDGYVIFPLLFHSLIISSLRRGRLLLQLGAVTVASFALLFLPFLPPFVSLAAILDPVTRIFPFSRGLFEDKVANFWCFSNVALKWRNLASPGTLVKLSTLLTAAGFMPAVVGLLRTGFSLRIKRDPIPLAAPVISTEKEVSIAVEITPKVEKESKWVRAEGNKSQGNGASATGPGPLFPLLLLSMLTSSISFFLFSFQVHEKTILVPLLPLTLIMVGASGSAESAAWELGMLTNNVAVFRWGLVKDRCTDQ